MSSPERSPLAQVTALATAVTAALDQRKISNALAAAAVARAAAGPTSTGAAPRHTAPQTGVSPVRTNPTSVKRPLKPKHLTADRLLLAGRRITDVAAAVRVHRYTVSRWQADPAFQAELRRQTAAATAAPARPRDVTPRATDGAAPRHVAPHCATFRSPPAQNEPNVAPRYSAAETRAILAGLPRPADRADP
jgi:hypothetical protein